MVENQDFTSPSVLKHPECSTKTKGNAEFTLALVHTGGLSFGGLVGWTDDGHFYSWGAHDDEVSQGVDLVLPKTGSARIFFFFKD